MATEQDVPSVERAMDGITLDPTKQDGPVPRACCLAYAHDLTAQAFLVCSDDKERINA
ncbi:MAG: hypothetical protein N2491_01030 [Negativicutes bacterium]|nr:hypothetical protein [Negativicutes bacterium]